MIPNLITNTFSSIAGEFANSAGPFMDPVGFDSSFVPSSLISLPTSFKLPSINQFQADMMKTMLTDGGRLELFQNPVADDVVDCRNKLLNVAVDATIDPTVAAAAMDMVETLGYFQDHTDRLSGVVETNANTSQYPTLEKAMAVGGTLDHIHQQLDGNPTNAPQLSLFGSFFEGKAHLSSLKDLLGNPTSALTADAIAAISQNMTNVIQNDVANYTIGLKKLKRLSVANIVFSSKDKQVEGGLMQTLFATDKTKGLFNDDTTQRNADQVSKSKAALDNLNNTRANTASFSQDFKTPADLIKRGGLFEGIQFTPAVLSKMLDMFPANQPGSFNDFLNSNFTKDSTQSDIDNYFAKSNQRGAPNDPHGYGQFLFIFYIDFLSRLKDANGPTRGDLYFLGKKRLGSINTVLVNKFLGKFGFAKPCNPDGEWGPTLQDQDGNPVPFSADQERELESSFLNGTPITTFKAYLVSMHVAGFAFDMSTYGGDMSYALPDNPLLKTGKTYVNGQWTN